MSYPARTVLGATLILLGAALAASPAAATEPDPATRCEATGPSPSCAFACPDGAHLLVYVEAPGFVGTIRGAAECGGARAQCGEPGACRALSPDSTDAGAGACTASDQAARIVCESLVEPSEGSACGADAPDYWRCGFTCTAGEQLHLDARTTGLHPSQEWPRLSAACGGVTIHCQANQACRASSQAVLYNDTGICLAETVKVDGVCTSALVAPPPRPPREKIGAGVPPTGVGPFSPMEISTPEILRQCPLGGVVCVGPIQERHVADTPGTPPVRAPGAAVWIDPAGTSLPRVDASPFGPVTTPTPVPITVCDRPCLVPSGTEGELVVAVGVDVWVGDEKTHHDVVLP